MKKILFIFLFCFVIIPIRGKPRMRASRHKIKPLVQSHHKPILKAGHKITLNQAHVVTDLKYTNSIRVSTISGRPICEVQNIDTSYSTLLGWGTDRQGGGMGYVLGSDPSSNLITEYEDDWFGSNIAKYNTQANQACSYPWVDGVYKCVGQGQSAGAGFTAPTYFDCLAGKGWWKKHDCRNIISEVPRCDNNYPITIMPVSGFKRYVQFELIEGPQNSEPAATWWDPAADMNGWNPVEQKYRIYECHQPFDVGASTCEGQVVPNVVENSGVLDFYVGDDIYFTLLSSDGYAPAPGVQLHELYIQSDVTKASTSIYQEKWQPVQDPITGDWSATQLHRIKFTKSEPINWRPMNMRSLTSSGNPSNPYQKSNPKEFGWKVSNQPPTQPDFNQLINAYLIRVWDNPMETFDVYLDYPTNKDGTDQQYFMVDVDLMGLVKPKFTDRYDLGSIDEDQVFSHWEPAPISMPLCTWEHWTNCVGIMNSCGETFWGSERGANFGSDYSTSMTMIRYDDSQNIKDFVQSNTYGWEGEACNNQWAATQIASIDSNECPRSFLTNNNDFSYRFTDAVGPGKGMNSLINCDGVSLQSLSSEMVETDCSLNYFKNYAQGDGECSQCVGVCLRAQYLTKCDESGAACTDLLSGEYCPPTGDQYISTAAINYGGNENAVYNEDSLADCDGICGGANRNCPYMYGWVMSKNRKWGGSGLESSNTKCTLNCVRWRGTMRMDNGFEEYITEPLGTIPKDENGDPDPGSFEPLPGLGNYRYENPKICDLLLKRDFDKKSILNHPWSRSCMALASSTSLINSQNFYVGSNTLEDLDALKEAICPNNNCAFPASGDLNDMEYGVWRQPAIAQSQYDIRHHQSISAGGVPTEREALEDDPIDISANQAGSAPN